MKNVWTSPTARFCLLHKPCSLYIFSSVKHPNRSNLFPLMHIFNGHICMQPFFPQKVNRYSEMRWEKINSTFKLTQSLSVISSYVLQMKCTRLVYHQELFIVWCSGALGCLHRAKRKGHQPWPQWTSCRRPSPNLNLKFTILHWEALFTNREPSR